MNNINKAAAAGVIFFMVILAGFVGIKIDRVTIAILAGFVIGVVIAAGTTVALISIARRPTERSAPQQPVQQLPPVTHNYYDNRRVVVVVNVPANANDTARRLTVANELRVLPSEAQRMIDAGEVQCLPVRR